MLNLRNFSTLFVSVVMAWSTVLFLPQAQATLASVDMCDIESKLDPLLTDATIWQKSSLQTSIVQKARADTPLVIERNEGQWGKGGAYVFRAGEMLLFLSSDEIRLVSEGGKALTLRFVGARRIDQALEQPAVTRLNYYLGSKPENWFNAIPTFTQIRFAQVYPGIDLVYKVSDGRLEYDFVVKPGADAGQIRLQTVGGEAVVDSQGNFVLPSAAGLISQLQPFTYQDIDGRRQQVSVAFRQVGHLWRLALGEYDRSHTLVIDPIISYSSYHGGNYIDNVNAVGWTSSGEMIIGGNTTSYEGAPWNDPAALPENVAEGWYHSKDVLSCRDEVGNSFAATLYDAFIAKYDINGQLSFATYFGGCRNDSVKDLFVDTSDLDHIYAVGTTSSEDFPVAGGFQKNFGGGSSQEISSDGFVVKLDVDGNRQYSSYLGGNGADRAVTVKVWNKEAYVTGTTMSDDMPGTSSGAYATYLAKNDAFLSRINELGNQVIYTALIGSHGEDFVTDFELVVPLDENYQPITASTEREILLYGTTDAGPSFSHMPSTTAVKGPAYMEALGGQCLAENGVGQTNSHACEDIFVIRLAGNTADSLSVINGTFLGGAQDDESVAIGVDKYQNVYLSGNTFSPPGDLAAAHLTYLAEEKRIHDSNTGKTALSFPLMNPLYQGEADTVLQKGFVAKFSPDLKTLLFSTFWGGQERDLLSNMQVIAHDSDTNLDGLIYLTGQTRSEDFPVKTAISGAAANGDGYISRLKTVTDNDTDPGIYEIGYSTLIGGSCSDTITDLEVDTANGRVLLSGTTRSENFPTTIDAAYGSYAGGLSEGQFLVLDETDTTTLSDLSVQVEKITKGVVNVDQKLSFRVTVQNDGPTATPAPGTTLAIKFPQSASGFSVPASANCVIANSLTLTCDLGALDLGANNSISLEMGFIALFADTVQLRVDVFSQHPDGDSSNNRQFLQFPVTEKPNRGALHPLALTVLALFAFLAWRRRIVTV